jgi:Ca2+-transporting ATPase
MRRPVATARLAGLLGSERGLKAAEADARRARFGANEIAEETPNALLDLLRDTARDPMIWFLAGTSGLYAFLGQGVEAATLLAASLPLVGMDAWLHRRTRASTEGLASRLAQQATVLRDGAATVVPALDVVPGDLALVSAAEAFPADGLLIEGGEIQVDESALTGEAYPVRKRVLASLPGDGEEPAVDALHWGLAGTRLLTGNAKLRVVYTGRETLYGEIVQGALGGEGARTPLQLALGRLVSLLVVAAAAMCVLLAAVRLWQGFGFLDALVSAATLAVAALPEEFPVVFSFFLGVGVYRLAKRQALVRRAVSVENIGRITCICSDKTGTITEGVLRLAHLEPARDATEASLLALAALASRVESGDPLDAAILAECAARGALPDAHSARVATFPFTEDRRRETAIIQEADGSRRAVMKGSPETLLARCDASDALRTGWRERVDALAAGAHKVVGCASRALDAGEAANVEPEAGYRFEGLLACEDPIREGVPEALASCAEAGIRTILVTGDHPLTARAVALEIGLGAGDPQVVSGDALDAVLSSPESAAARRFDVVARAMPAQKLALVRALRALGEVVAVTGDGVNDVPALQAADVGIAMGERATRSAREVAAIVLLDDNFRTIVRAIGEGRQLYANLRLAFQYLLLVHVPLVVTAALVPLAGFPLLYLPVHIVWLELIIHPTALLVFQDLPESDRLARRGPGAQRARFFGTGEWVWMLAVAGALTALVAGVWVRGLATDVLHARALALATLVLASGAVTLVLGRLRSRAARLVPIAALAASVALLQIPALAERLHLRPLDADDWLVALAGVGVAVVLPLELGLRMRRRRARMRRL